MSITETGGAPQPERNGQRRGRGTRVDDVTLLVRELIKDHRRRGLDRLPPESRLSAELGVSRNTLRAALARLEADGDIQRRRKVGTLITRPAEPAGDERVDHRLAYPVDLVQSVADFFIEAGVPYAVRSVTLRHEAPDVAAAEHLGVAEGDFVYRVSRTYEMDGCPAVVVEHSLPRTLKGLPVRISALADGVTTFLHEEHGIRLSRSDHWVTALAADAELSRELEVPSGTPLLAVVCKLFTEGSTPVAIGRLVFRPDLVGVRASATVVISPPEPGTPRASSP